MEKSPNLIFSFYLSRFFCPFLYLTPPPIKAYIDILHGFFHIKALLLAYISPRHTCLKSRIWFAAGSETIRVQI